MCVCVVCAFVVELGKKQCVRKAASLLLYKSMNDIYCSNTYIFIFVEVSCFHFFLFINKYHSLLFENKIIICFLFYPIIFLEFDN